MSRLPTLSTPGRPSPTTGIPTPTGRRPRSSLGPGHALPAAPDDAMDRALQEALRTRPPSSLRNNGDDASDAGSVSGSGLASHSLLGPPGGLAAPRTPGVRPKTPSGLGMPAPVTPVAGRSLSRAGLGRPSLSQSTTTPYTPRRTSMASSTTSTTPYAHVRRPESRASERDVMGAKWVPVVGEKVRISSMGYEGVLRFYGQTQFKEGVWAGVELEGGFKGKGKNDGTVEGVQYFSCPPLCGIFVTAVKLSPPTTGASRPASAASHRSTASYSISASGRATPSISGRATPSISGRATPSRAPSSTPGRGISRSVSSARPRASVAGGGDDDAIPTRTALGASTSANAGIESRITAGSRASRYLGMTAKQLDSARATGPSTTPGGGSKLGMSTSTVTGPTPKASRISMGLGTPVRPRQSVGTSLATPKARGPRASNMHEMMPPPPSPGNINRVMSARQVEALEEEIRELKRRNGELEEELKHLPEMQEAVAAAGAGAGASAEELERAREEAAQRSEEADALRAHLETAETNASDAVKVLEELQAEYAARQEELDVREKEVGDLRKELKIVGERSEQELAAGAEARNNEVKRVQERAEAAELEAAEMKALVDELTNAGQQMISLSEAKQYELEEQKRQLEDKLHLLEEKNAKLREERERSLLPPSPTTRQREAATAAEIDNETLTAQVKHLQNKISNLEEEIEEVRAQAESDAEVWKGRVTRAKDGEKAAREEGASLKGEIKELKEQAAGAKARVGELEGALQENQAALEGARAEIEGLRADAQEAASMRSALAAAAENEKALKKLQAQAEELRKALQEKEEEVRRERQVGEDARGQISDLEAKIASLEAEIATLKQTAQSNISNNLPSPSAPPLSRAKLSSSSNSSEDADKKIRGFQHIIGEMSTENAELKEQCESLKEEVTLMKEELKLLEEAAAEDSKDGKAAEADGKELADARATIKELNREVAELETLIEAKIYREEDLETRASALERELARYRKSSASASLGHHAHANGEPPLSATSATFSGGSDGHTSSTGTATERRAGAESGGEDGEERCELCEGPHDLDACPVFAGNMSGGAGASGELKMKGGKWCADCESNEHDTAECPMAEDVF
ncbi:hypothetical protein IAT38_006382 [Cryptococcus sp. DSM 104549]